MKRGGFAVEKRRRSVLRYRCAVICARLWIDCTAEVVASWTQTGNAPYMRSLILKA